MKSILTAAAVAVIAIAVPASAQSTGSDGSSTLNGPSAGGGTVQSGGAMAGGHAVTNAKDGDRTDSASMKHRKAKTGSSTSGAPGADTGMANTVVGGSSGANGGAGNGR